jgi:HTH-type transcriptional regulator/antitoxin MqsA
MWQCDVCGSTHSHQEVVSEVFNIDGRPVLVENIPARICDRCSEATFSRETTEKIRHLVHDDVRPARTIHMDVFAYQ